LKGKFGCRWFFDFAFARLGRNEICLEYERHGHHQAECSAQHYIPDYCGWEKQKDGKN
jgi:hypothetical protein